MQVGNLVRVSGSRSSFPSFWNGRRGTVIHVDHLRNWVSVVMDGEKGGIIFLSNEVLQLTALDLLAEI
jgi:hypothetical protein